MSAFVDTGLFYAHHDADASRHEIGIAALNGVLRAGEYGRVMTSDHVCDEAVTLTQRRTPSVADGIEVGRRIRGDGYPDAVELFYSSRGLYEDAVGVYGRYADRALSFADAMTVAMVQHHDIDAVVSFDDGFDGVVDRLAPDSIGP
jgi:hypothetical protein